MSAASATCRAGAGSVARRSIGRGCRGSSSSPRFYGTPDLTGYRISAGQFEQMETSSPRGLDPVARARRIVERGSYEELMAARGAYYGMVVRQTESHVRAAEGEWI